MDGGGYRSLSLLSNCQELYFLDDTTTPILETDASEYGIGGYMYMVLIDKSESYDSSASPSQDHN
jgi:hypothetical protein